MIINLCVTTIPPLIKTDHSVFGPDAHLTEVWIAWIEGSDTPGCVAKDPYTAIGAVLRQKLQFGTWETPEELKIEGCLAQQYHGFLKDDPEGHLRSVGKSLFESGGEKSIDLQFRIHTTHERVEANVEEWEG